MLVCCVVVEMATCPSKCDCVTEFGSPLAKCQGDADVGSVEFPIEYITCPIRIDKNLKVGSTFSADKLVIFLRFFFPTNVVA